MGRNMAHLDLHVWSFDPDWGSSFLHRPLDCDPNALIWIFGCVCLNWRMPLQMAIYIILYPFIRKPSMIKCGTLGYLLPKKPIWKTGISHGRTFSRGAFVRFPGWPNECNIAWRSSRSWRDPQMWKGWCGQLIGSSVKNIQVIVIPKVLPFL